MYNLVIKNCNVVDAADEKISLTNVYVSDGKIVHVGEDFNFGSENKTKVVDAGGRYALPGLVNLHVHMFGSGKPSKTLGGGKTQQRLIKFIKTRLGNVILKMLVKSSAKKQLLSGVTTLRSVGDFEYSDVAIRDKINAGKIAGPRMICCGPAITVPGGHGDGTFAITGATPDELRALVDKNAQHGVDWIKICVTGGVMDAKAKGEPGELRMSLEQTAAVCERAHELGFKVCSHTESPAGMKVAIEGGVDTVEHGAFFDDEDARLLKERGGAIVSTFSPALPLAKLPPDVTKLNELCRFNTEVVLDGMISCERIARANGIDVGLGTDASCPLCTQYNTWRELVFYTRMANVSNAHALYTATTGNATILGLQDEIGSIETGKCADIILVNENPLDNLSTLKNPYAVIKSGRVFKAKPKKNKTIEKYLDEM